MLPFRCVVLIFGGVTDGTRAKVIGNWVIFKPSTKIDNQPATLHDAINMARELIEQGVQAKALRIGDSNKRKWGDQQGNNYHQQQNQRQEAAKVYVAAPAKGRGYAGNLPSAKSDEPLVVPLDGLHIDDKLYFIEENIEIRSQKVEAKLYPKLSRLVGTLGKEMNIPGNTKTNSERNIRIFFFWTRIVVKCRDLSLEDNKAHLKRKGQ
ncbi:hypothetical protein Tco_0644150 [Tanacetum coccineum]